MGLFFEGFSEPLHALVSSYVWQARKSFATENCLGNRSFTITPRSHNKFLFCYAEPELLKMPCYVTIKSF